jgi:hypothetical protein
VDLKPVIRYRLPEYPSRDYLLEHPELLRLLPKRWQGNRLVLTALGMAACLISCAHQPQVDHQEASLIGSKVAPLFVHGDGQGSFGCIVISPPVFLSEDEAQAVIRREARRAGIRFDYSATDSILVELPFTQRFPALIAPQCWVESPAGSTEPSDSAVQTWRNRKTEPRAIHFDGVDSLKHIRFVYVNGSDYRAWKQSPPPSKYIVMSSTASHVDIRGAADSLHSALTKTIAEDEGPPQFIGIFYDPMEKMGYNEHMMSFENRATACRHAEYELSRQVHDFIHWLKAEGVI